MRKTRSRESVLHKVTLAAGGRAKASPSSPSALLVSPTTGKRMCEEGRDFAEVIKKQGRMLKLSSKIICRMLSWDQLGCGPQEKTFAPKSFHSTAWERGSRSQAAPQPSDRTWPRAGMPSFHRHDTGVQSRRRWGCWGRVIVL